MNKGLISIIIPTFNRAELVERAVRSVLEQDYPHKQIIVIDDGSTDDTRERLSVYPNIDYHWQENQGQPAARNHGLQFAQGEFLVSLDSDDFWSPTFLSQSITALADSDLGFVFSLWQPAGPAYVREFRLNSRLRALSDLQYFQNDKRGDWYYLTPGETRRLFIHHCWAPSSSVLIRRSMVGRGWNTSMRLSDDWMLMLEIILKHAPGAAFNAKALWTKWQDGSNIYAQQNDAARVARQEISDNQVMLATFGELLTREEQRIFRHRIMVSYCDWGYHESRQGHHGTAIALYVRGLYHAVSHRPAIEICKVILRPLIQAGKTAHRTTS